VSGPAIFLSAGEPSGDRHGASLARALLAAAPGCRLAGIGGEGMAEAGVRLIHDLGPLQAVGLVESAGSLPAHLRALRMARRELREGRYDLAVLVDYPGFHRRVAAAASHCGIPVLHYIAPQFWAWGGWRVAGHRRTVTHTAVILPFEAPFFRARRVPATFVGHPLRDTPPIPRSAARAQLGLPEDALVLGLFPGSRPREVAQLWARFRDAAQALLASHAGLRVLVAGPPDTRVPGLGTLDARLAPAALVAAAADAAIAKSGTTTLELALAGTPHVLAYRMHPVTFAAARLAVSVRWVGLVNLVLDRPIVPELLQSAARSSTIADAVQELLAPASAAAARQRAAFGELAERLGPAGAARRTAELALSLVA
jgi:lipid-A-disaccharide synthase